MCGFAGILFDRETEISGERIQNLLLRLSHRGPDDQGVLILNDRGVERLEKPPASARARLVLVHRRLSILDLSKAGWQPMQSEDARHHVVFNGEIYNYIELGRELAAAGVPIQSSSDTEVLLKACATWGRDALRRFTGMFSFAWLDSGKRTLLLARDFFGIKPLYYARFDGGLTFGSEIKALLDAPGLKRGVDADRLYTYLRYGISDFGDRTLYADIRQVPAGNALSLGLDAAAVPAPELYWQAPVRSESGLTFDQAAERLRQLFLDSVRLHMRSDVPIGSALSGGIDSSAIVMAMRQVDPGAKLHAFSYIADDPAVSEERYIDCIVKAAGATLHPVRLSPADLSADLEALVASQDEPFLSTSIYAQYRIFKAAKEAGIKVMLDGQGADEMLAGYDQYLGYRAATLVRTGRRMDALRLLKGMRGMGRRLRTGRRVGEVLAPGFLQSALRRLAGEELMPDWMNGRWFESKGVTPRALREPGDDLSMTGELRRTLTRTTLPMLLRFEDRNSMAHSIESRVPFLTPALVEFLWSLPEDYLLSSEGVTKSVFRKALQGIVPDEILSRRDKIGFETPQRKWLEDYPLPTGDLASGKVLADGALGYLQQRLKSGDPKAGGALWRCISLELWARNRSIDFGA